MLSREKIHILETKTSGKLFIAGEYQVLNDGVAVIYGIPKYMTFRIEKSDTFTYKSRNVINNFEINNDEVINKTSGNDKIIMAAFSVSFNYLKKQNIEITPFKLEIITDLENKSHQKYGFGSSAALISGIIKIVNLYFLKEISNESVFKLAVLAQIKIGELSSGGDLAASIYKKTVYYRKYDQKWLLKEINKKNFDISKNWKNLIIKEIETKLKFGAVWTKVSYKTKKLERKISKKEIIESKRIVKETYLNLIKNNYLATKNSINNYQEWLEKILMEDNLVTEEIKLALQVLRRFNLEAKISGAGGGDSVIFLYPEGFNFKKLEEALKINKLELFVF